METVTESWLPIPGYEGIYEVSDQGRVRSFKRFPYILSAPHDAYGYPCVSLYIDRGRKTWKVHRLVLFAFVGPMPKGLEIRHLDGNPANGTLSNLVYGTRSENVSDRVRHGTHHNANKTRCPKGHPYDELNTDRSQKNRRECRTCQRARSREYFRKRR